MSAWYILIDASNKTAVLLSCVRWSTASVMGGQLGTCHVKLRVSSAVHANGTVWISEFYAATGYRPTLSFDCMSARWNSILRQAGGHRHSMSNSHFSLPDFIIHYFKLQTVINVLASITILQIRIRQPILTSITLTNSFTLACAKAATKTGNITKLCITRRCQIKTLYDFDAVLRQIIS